CPRTQRWLSQRGIGDLHARATLAAARPAWSVYFEPHQCETARTRAADSCIPGWRGRYLDRGAHTASSTQGRSDTCDFAAGTPASRLRRDVTPLEIPVSGPLRTHALRSLAPDACAN